MTRIIDYIWAYKIRLYATGSFVKCNSDEKQTSLCCYGNVEEKISSAQ